mgnify:CR=1 FL=1
MEGCMCGGIELESVLVEASMSAWEPRPGARSPQSLTEVAFGCPAAVHQDYFRARCLPGKCPSGGIDGSAPARLSSSCSMSAWACSMSALVVLDVARSLPGKCFSGGIDSGKCSSGGIDKKRGAIAETMTPHQVEVTRFTRPGPPPQLVPGAPCECRRDFPTSPSPSS